MKRIIVCCDGTWNNPEQKHATNVAVIARLILPADPSGDPQVVFYDWGVGSSKNITDRISGGAFGEGLDRNIRDGYRFIVHNYEPGDKIYIFGFSRGAYTARSLAGLLRNAGVLRKSNAHLIPKAYALYRSRHTPNAKRSKEFRTDHSHQDQEIRFVGVWDTVGALGVPLKVLNFLNKKYAFHDTKLSSIVEAARHAVAIDEKRESFTPTLWEVRNTNLDVQQVWFPGVHCDIGGGYKEKGLADHALQWMIAEAKKAGLAFDNGFVAARVKPDSLDTKHTSYKGAYWLLGKAPRRIDEVGKAQLHHSVRERWQGNPRYRPRNLRKYLNEYGW